MLLRIFRIALTRRIILNSLRIAAVVGTLLNLINQGGQILSGAGVSWMHVALNFVVPYTVASYSAARNELDKQDVD